jgi:SAM-dependent methyltransferase
VDTPAGCSLGSRAPPQVSRPGTGEQVEYVDLRPVRSNVRALQYRQGSITDLPFASVSALHVVEHIGLGRYGDPIDPAGWLKAIGELRRVLAPGGSLYFSVPIGTERLEFDGHRVFDRGTILGAFRPLRLRRFSYVDDDGDLVEDADPAAVRGWYSCGLFLLTKPPGPS